MNGNLCQVVLMNKCYDNPEKESNRVQKSVTTRVGSTMSGLKNVKLSKRVLQRRLENASL